MPNYKYNGFTKSGKPVKGIKEASSKQAALTALAEEGILISDLEENVVKKRRLFSGKKNLADLFFQLSLLLRSGIPLVNALEIIVHSSTNATEQQIISDVISKVSEGMRFSEALSRHTEYFTDMYVNLIRASENVGRLAQVLMDMAEYEENKRKNSDKLFSAMIYPLVILFMGLVVLSVLMIFVVPKMQSIFSAAKQELPAVTKLLLATADFSRSYGAFFLIFFVICVVLLVYFYRNHQKFRMWADRKLYNVTLISQSAITRFSHVLAFQLKEGLPLSDALKYANMTVQNKYMKSMLEVVRNDVQSGVRFSAAVRGAGIFPELFPAAVSTGESSGNMPELLERVNEFYSKNIEKLTSVFLSVVEPVFIVFIGALVAFIVVAIMLPLLSMNTMVG